VSNPSTLTRITSKIANAAVIGRIMLIIGLVLSVLLSFYWDFRLESLSIKEIYTLDTGTVTLSLAPEFILALVGIFVFYAGYRVYSRKKWGGEARISTIESGRELVAKFAIVIGLGIAGIWYTLAQFSTKGLWDYHIPNVVKIATGSLALAIDAAIALVLLIVLVIEVRFRYEKSVPQG
jgi:hypothetical protein